MQTSSSPAAEANTSSVYPLFRSGPWFPIKSVYLLLSEMCVGDSVCLCNMCKSIKCNRTDYTAVSSQVTLGFMLTLKMTDEMFDLGVKM